jgi:hypothetical protein
MRKRGIVLSTNLRKASAPPASASAVKKSGAASGKYGSRRGRVAGREKRHAKLAPSAVLT